MNVHRLHPLQARLHIASSRVHRRDRQEQGSPFWYASELTRPLGLHQSAATRLAQRLGFAGYPELRDAVRQDYLAGAGPSQRVLGRLERHADDEVLRSFVDDEIEALSALNQHVSQAEIDDIAARLTTAGTVYLYGQGNATILVDQLSRRLQRFGINPVALVGSKRDIAERVAGIGPADLLVAFAFRRLPSTLAHGADGHRQRRGAHHGQDLTAHHHPHPGFPGRNPRPFRRLTSFSHPSLFSPHHPKEVSPCSFPDTAGHLPLPSPSP
jgi:hypothetical protein